MGASALVSALNALPWEDEEEGSSSSDEDEEVPDVSRPSASRRPQRKHTLCRSLHSELIVYSSTSILVLTHHSTHVRKLG